SRSWWVSLPDSRFACDWIAFRSSLPPPSSLRAWPWSSPSADHGSVARWPRPRHPAPQLLRSRHVAPEQRHPFDGLARRGPGGLAYCARPGVVAPHVAAGRRHLPDQVAFHSRPIAQGDARGVHSARGGTPRRLRRLAAPWGLGGRGRVRRHTATSGRHQLRGVAGGRVAGDRDDRIVDHRHPPQSDQSGHWVRTARERNLSLRVDPESPRTVPGRDGSPPGRVRRHLRHGHRALPYQSRVRQPRFRAPDPAEGTVILAALLTVPAAAGGLALLA